MVVIRIAIALGALLLVAVGPVPHGIAANGKPALTGKPVVGTTDPAAAPDLTTGTYLIDLPVAGSTHFRLRRTAPGTTFHVALQSLGRGHSIGEGLEIRLGTDTADGGCGSAVTFRPTIVEPQPLLTVAASTWADESDHECANADSLLLAVAAPTDPKDAERAAQLLVYEEPPLTRAAYDLLDTPDLPTWTAAEPGKATRVKPGLSTADAPVLGDGTTTFRLAPGRTAVVGIPLDWGQSLSAQVDGKRPTGWDDERLGLEAHMLGPMLTTSEVAVTAPEVSPRRLLRAAQSLTIAYPQRDSIDSMINGAAMAGIHYVAINYRPEVVGDATTSSAPPLDLTLTLTTHDSAPDALPGYTPVDGLAAPRADAVLADADPPPPADTRADTVDTTTDAGPLTADADVPWARIGLFAAAVAVVGLLLRLVFAGFAAVRRRRRARRIRHGRHRG